MEYDVRYPLLQKYDAPVISGVIRNEDFEVWLRTLPDDWGERFGAVCGPVTAPLDAVPDRVLWKILSGLWKTERNTDDGTGKRKADS